MTENTCLKTEIINILTPVVYFVRQSKYDTVWCVKYRSVDNENAVDVSTSLRLLLS